MEPPRLVALTPGTLREVRGSDLLARMEAAIEAGLRGVLLREPLLADAATLELARALRALLEPVPGGWLALHDRPHLLAASGADACHLGHRSLSCAEVRAAFGADTPLGLSTHAGDDVAGWAEADYLFHGPLHATGSHPDRAAPDWTPPVGADGLRRAVAATNRPLLAIGGIGPAEVPEALRAGAHGVAVLSGIVQADDPARSVTAYLDAMGVRA